MFLPANTDGVADDPQQAYNWVLDLRNSSEIEFSIPYNNIVEWSQVRLVTASGALSNDNSIGTIRIEVLNPLRAPESVSNTIDFNIWMAGESDLQFAIPTFANYVPSLRDVAPFEAQVLGSQQDRGFNDMCDKPKLFDMKTPPKIAPCAATIGEIVTNLRALTRRFARTTTLSKNVAGKMQWDLPSYYFAPIFDPAVDVLDNYSITPLDYISFIYRFFRGGNRYKFMVAGASAIDTTAYQEAILAAGYPSARVPTTVNDALYNKFYNASASFMHRLYVWINPILEITTPFYSQTIIRPIVGVDSAQPENMTSNSLLYRISGNYTCDVDVLRAAADDFTFGWLLGAPTLRSRNTGFNTINIDLSGVNIIVANEGTLIATALISALTPVTPGTYTITSSSPTTLDVIDFVTNVLPGTPVSLRVNPDGVTCELTVTFPYAGNATDTNATEANWQAVAILDVSLS